MGIDSVALKENAQAKIKDNGFEATLKLVTYASGGDDWNKSANAATTTNTTVYLLGTKLTQKEIDGSRILATDRAFLLSTENLTEAPVDGSKLVIESDEFNMNMVSILAPANVDIFYKIAVRK